MARTERSVYENQRLIEISAQTFDKNMLFKEFFKG